MAAGGAGGGAAGGTPAAQAAAAAAAAAFAAPAAVAATPVASPTEATLRQAGSERPERFRPLMQQGTTEVCLLVAARRAAGTAGACGA